MGKTSLYRMLGGILLVALLGCSSSRSTVLLRDQTNTAWRKKRAHGIPITLKVPTHVKLYVYEKHYLEAVDVGGVQTVKYLELPVVLRDFAQDFIYTEKVIMVDFKRPAAGAFNLEVDLTDDQYIQKIQHDVTDETIQRVTELVDTLAPAGLFTPSSGEEPGANVEPRVKEVKSVVAVGVFEIDAPDFEQQMGRFIDCHINRSHDAWVVPPGVEGFRRTPLDPSSTLPGPVLCPSDGCSCNGVGAMEIRYPAAVEPLPGPIE